MARFTCVLAGLALLMFAGPMTTSPLAAQGRAKSTSTAPPPSSAAMAAAADAAARARGEFASAEAVLRWINDYRLQPTPSRLPQAVRALSRSGTFRDLEQSGVYIGFMAGVLSDNQLTASKLVAGMFPMPPEEQTAIVKAIAYSGLPEWKELLGQFVERMPARRVMIDSYLRGKAKLLYEVPLESGPAALDTLWGFYFATGRHEPVQRIITVLAWAAEKKDVTRLTIGGMAKWTLASNAARDKAILDLCRHELTHRPKEIAVQLKEVVEAADQFEITRIRAQAIAAIDALKRKGPAPEGNRWAWWAQATSVAISFGCVIAGVTGHAELGIPCIVSGAMAQGAARFLGGSAAVPQ